MNRAKSLIQSASMRWTEITPYEKHSVLFTPADYKKEFDTTNKSIRIPRATYAPNDKYAIRTPQKDKEKRQSKLKERKALTDMVEEAIKSKLDNHYEPNNYISSEIDLSRYV